MPRQLNSVCSYIYLTLPYTLLLAGVVNIRRNALDYGNCYISSRSQLRHLTYFKSYSLRDGKDWRLHTSPALSDGSRLFLGLMGV